MNLDQRSISKKKIILSGRSYIKIKIYSNLYLFERNWRIIVICIDNKSKYQIENMKMIIYHMIREIENRLI